MAKTPIGIIGLGMVGGAYARWFERQGHQVFRFDTNSIGSQSDVNRAEVVCLAVPTPFDEARGTFDGAAIEEAVSWLCGSKTVVIKSTVLPGTTASLQQRYPGHRFFFSPEFLTEATADEDVAHPKLSLIGYTDKSRAAAETIRLLFPAAAFEKVMPSGEAEFFKYLRNTFFATKIVFFNQMYDLAVAAGLDFEAIRECAANDPWVAPGGQHTVVWHQGYRGYGGKCLPKDTKALISFSKSLGVAQPLLETAEQVNGALAAQAFAVQTSAPPRAEVGES